MDRIGLLSLSTMVRASVVYALYVEIDGGRPIVDVKVTPIWNTIAVIPGHIKSEVVVVGNHRDGEAFLINSYWVLSLMHSL